MTPVLVPGHLGYVYRLFGDGDDLLYVGKTRDPRARMGGHASRSSFWCEVREITVVVYSNMSEADAEEDRAIREECPRYNRQRRTIAETSAEVQGIEASMPLTVELPPEARAVPGVRLNEVEAHAAAMACIREAGSRGAKVIDIRTAATRSSSWVHPWLHDQLREGRIVPRAKGFYATSDYRP